jgi:hypothetical protein
MLRKAYVGTLVPFEGKTWPNVPGDSVNEAAIESISNIESRITARFLSIFLFSYILF